MYLSQFTIYSSADASHPVLSGTSGSLLALFNACLITGYGSKVGAGWSKTGSLGPALGLAISDNNNCGIFVQPTGSQATLFVTDNAPGVNGGTKEARLVGFDYVTQFTSSTSTTVTGSNQFPIVTQLAVGNGAVVSRKSTTADGSERTWILFADSSSVYFYNWTGANDIAAVTYDLFMFGDIFSMKSGSNDTSKCMIVGNIGENIAWAVTYHRGDLLSLVNATTTGHFMQRSFSGQGGSITVGKHGDGAKGSTTTLLGSTQCPNGPNNGLYISPVWVHESSNAMIRGTMRGFWHLCHPIANFSDGQIITGTDDYVGRTFMVIKQGSNSGIYCMETSATVNTN